MTTKATLPPDIAVIVSAIREAWADASQKADIVRDLNAAKSRASSKIAEIEADDSLSVEVASKAAAAQRDILATAEARAARAEKARSESLRAAQDITKVKGSAIMDVLTALRELRRWNRINALVAHVREWIDPAFLTPGQEGNLRSLLYQMSGFDRDLSSIAGVEFSPWSDPTAYTADTIEPGVAYLEENAEEVVEALAFMANRNAEIAAYSARGAVTPLHPSDWITFDRAA